MHTPEDVVSARIVRCERHHSTEAEPNAVHVLRGRTVPHLWLSQPCEVGLQIVAETGGHSRLQQSRQQQDEKQRVRPEYRHVDYLIELTGNWWSPARPHLNKNVLQVNLIFKRINKMHSMSNND